MRDVPFRDQPKNERQGDLTAQTAVWVAIWCADLAKNVLNVLLDGLVADPSRIQVVKLVVLHSKVSNDTPENTSGRFFRQVAREGLLITRAMQSAIIWQSTYYYLFFLALKSTSPAKGNFRFAPIEALAHKIRTHRLAFSIAPLTTLPQAAVKKRYGQRFQALFAVRAPCRCPRSWVTCHAVVSLDETLISASDLVATPVLRGVCH